MNASRLRGMLRTSRRRQSIAEMRERQALRDSQAADAELLRLESEVSTARASARSIARGPGGDATLAARQAYRSRFEKFVEHIVDARAAAQASREEAEAALRTAREERQRRSMRTDCMKSELDACEHAVRRVEENRREEHLADLGRAAPRDRRRRRAE